MLLLKITKPLRQAYARRFHFKLDGAHCASQLRRKGFAVVDNVFSTEFCDSLVSELKNADASGLLIPNATHLVAPDRKTAQFFEKPRINEIELLNPENQAVCPTFSSLQNDPWLIDLFQPHFPHLKIDSQAIKGQVNSGHGGCFPIHPDSDFKTDQRHISCIVYLNKNWKQGDGGELRLYPFPYAHIDIEPLFNRMVLFSSSLMLHRVLPSQAERFAFTIWLSGPGERLIDLPFTGDRESDAWAYVLSPKNRKHVARLIYSEEWAESIEESHHNPRRLVEDHWKSVQIIVNAFRSHLPLISQLPLGPDSKLPEHFPDELPWF